MEQTTLIYHFVVLPGSFVSIFFSKKMEKKPYWKFIVQCGTLKQEIIA